MNAAELFALVGIDFDDKAEKNFNDKLNGFSADLGSWADKSSSLMGQAFSIFFLQDLYDIASAGIHRVTSLLNPASVFDMTKGLAGSLDVIAKQARELKISTRALQEYNFIAGQNGIAQELFVASFTKATVAVSGAVSGSKDLRKAFKDLGLSFRDLNKMAPDKRFDAIIGGLAGVEDVVKQTGIGIKIFGEGFPKFASLLKGGAEGIAQLKKEAQKLGFVVSDEDTAKAESFNDALDRTTRAFGALKNFALTPLMGPLTDLLDGMKDFIVANRDLLVLPFETFGQVFIFVFKSAAEAMVFMTKTLKSTREFVNKFIKTTNDLNQVLKVALALSIGFALSWAWTRASLLVPFLHSLAAAVYTLGLRLLFAAGQAFNFMRTMTLASAWGAIKAGFAAISAALAGTTAQFIIIGVVIAGILLILEDIYKFFTGGQSLILGKIFKMDPNNQRDLEKFYDTLLAIGLVLGGVLTLLAGIPGLIAIVLVLVAYLAANWDLVVVALENAIDAMWDGLRGLAFDISDWAVGVGKSISDLFFGIIDTIADSIRDILSTFDAIPAKARSIISSLPGADLLGLSGGEIVGATVGGGAASPNIDRVSRIYEARNSRAVNISPSIEVKVDATDKTPAQAAEAFQNGVMDELFRKIGNAYDGDET